MKYFAFSVLAILNLATDGMLAVCLLKIHPLLGAGMALFAVASTIAFPVVLDRISNGRARGLLSRYVDE